MTARAKRFCIMFGERVRTLRLERGLSQEWLAKRVKLGRTSICNIEAGRQKVLAETVVDLADALGIDPGDLMTGLW